MTKYLIFILPLLLITIGCNFDKNIREDVQLKVEEFNLSQLYRNGEKLYTIYSPISKFNQTEQIYKLDNTNIKFYDNNELKYIINSNNAVLDNNNKVVKLIGEIKIIDITEEDNVINADNLVWNINKSEFILEGNVTLNDSFKNLKSSKAILNKNTDIIEFFQPVKYEYKEKKTKTNFKISAKSAFYNLKTKSMVFKSESDRVRSNLSL